MCLSLPKQVVLIKKDNIVVKSAKGQQKVGAIIKVRKGDWVLTQNNVIIKKISKKQAEEIKNLLQNTD